jgi:hypothetical protein
MVVTRRASGPGKYTLRWEGATVLKHLEEAARAGMEAEKRHVEAAEQSELHVWTGEMKEKSFAIVEVRGTKRVLLVGSDAPHTIYHEERATNYTPHPQFHQLMDQHAPHVTQEIRKAVAARGLGGRGGR